MSGTQGPGYAAERSGERVGRPAVTVPAILLTKLHIPPPRAGVVPRPELFARLQSGLRGKVTLIAAPAGSGKTTLLGAWSATATGREVPLVWLALDEADNDAARFWRHAIAALDQLLPGAGDAALALLAAREAPAGELFIDALINSLVGLPRDAALVLDDYHAIENTAIHRALSYLIDHLPPRLHLIVASRADPPLPLARLRARGELTEIRARDLRFTTAEAAVLLAGVAGASLGADAVGMLVGRTEGWAAGLHLAALALRDQPEAERGEFVARFAGNQRYVADYLLAEVLECQPPATRRFLLDTAICARLCGDLCDALAAPGDGYADGQATLEALEHAGLFLVPLDTERRWYRYHHLFADLLRHHAHRAGPEQVARLQRLAGDWFAAHGLADEAIGHFLAAGAPERAADVIEAVAPAATVQSEHATLARWLAALPGELVRARPGLGVATAWLLVVAGRIAELEERLRAVEMAPGAVVFAGEVAALRGLALVLSDTTASIAASRRSLELLPEGAVSLRAVVAVGLGSAYWFAGEPAAAEEVLTLATGLTERTGDRVTGSNAWWALGIVRELQGRLADAYRCHERALLLASGADGQPYPTVAAARAAMHLGIVAWERGDSTRAEEHLQLSLRIARHWPESDLLWPAPLSLARVRRAQGAATEAASLAAETRAFGRRVNQPYTRLLIAIGLARYHLAEGDAAAARDVLDHLVPPEMAANIAGLPATLRDYHRRTDAHVHLAAGHPGRALAMLEPLLAPAEAAGRHIVVIEVLALLALARDALAERRAALADLSRALSAALPERQIRPFADLGPALVPLLSALLSPGRDSVAESAAPDLRDYAANILAAIPGVQPVPAHPARPNSVLPDALSAREREVLQLIAAGYDNAAIAGQIFVATSTVKTHINRIFAKLGVASRMAAVARARALGLLNE